MLLSIKITYNLSRTYIYEEFMKTRKIGIVGYGYVGKAMFELFKTHYDVVYYDTYLEKSCTKEEINACDLAVVCVPTPMNEKNNYECDTSIVEEVITWIDSPLILLKSTVEIGTTEKLKTKFNKRIVFSPEYCGESRHHTGDTFTTSIRETPFFTFGGDRNDCDELIDIFMPVTGPSKTYRTTTATDAEVAKYMENTFFGVKVAFCYEMDQICKVVGANFNEVRDLWLLDPRINRSHTGVMENNDQPFGGKCLPKDINGLVQCAKRNGYDANLIQEVLDSNIRIGDIRKEQ
jgi:UDPglucose 6-dehydrogenase